MNYYKVNLIITPPTEIHRDVLSALLADIGFESFMETGKGLDAFVPEKNYSEAAIAGVLENFPLPDVQVRYSVERIKSVDWNEAWEKHFFQPVIIDNQVIIHSSFHKDIPQLPYDIVIDPKMAFGTGHHATTSLMVSYLLEQDLNNRSFLDMGCGTAVLAILASKKGAHPATAIDNDEWAYKNALENIRLNNTPSIRVAHGDANLLEKESYDIIFANINRNILLNDIHRYVQSMRPGASLFMSGFYTDDRAVITCACNKYNLSFISSREQSDWTAIHFKKMKQ
ncbi:MAG: 50S ribosomal protein L11 methyltransferase [Dysgonamonadaceae bacterium]|jgi:ribosomal protein L11 methyltransferase|nr:50S ribosomal protein L11 methyltransferase [Dysgonamonadaceae bacterium]